MLSSCTNLEKIPSKLSSVKSIEAELAAVANLLDSAPSPWLAMRFVALSAS